MSDASGGIAGFPDLGVLNYVSAADHDRLVDRLQEAGVRLVLLNGEAIRGAADLFAAVTEQGIADGPVAGWAAFRDRLEVALAPGKQPVALVWTDVHRLLDGALADLVTGAGILADLSRRFYAEGRVFVTFLEGKGANFPRLQ